ncbi:MAG: twin-arginine translocase subunit TatC [Myxococcota bacterium]|nr:twin-arginine translocase subunit TatC [Myxococcota bacterium]
MDGHTDPEQLEELEQSRMGFLEHLNELRVRLMRTVVVLFLAALACFTYADELFVILQQPLKDLPDAEMIVLTPLEMFITHLKIAAVAGIFVTSPWALLQVWLFIAPGLYGNEKKWIAPFVILGTLSFCAGGAFAFYIVMPMGFEYLVAMVPETVSAQYSVAAYFTLVIRLLLAFGLVFELPLIMWMLAAAGVMNPAKLQGLRKYWVVIAVIMAAFFTPPDPFTQMLMAVPLMLFFEIGLLGARFIYRAPSE